MLLSAFFFSKMSHPVTNSPKLPSSLWRDSIYFKGVRMMELNAVIIVSMIIFTLIGGGIVTLEQKIEELKRERKRKDYWYRV